MHIRDEHLRDGSRTSKARDRLRGKPQTQNQALTTSTTPQNPLVSVDGLTDADKPQSSTDLAPNPAASRFSTPSRNPEKNGFSFYL